MVKFSVFWSILLPQPKVSFTYHVNAYLYTRAHRAHYPHTNGEPLLKWSFSHYSSAKILLVVWSANGDGI